MSVLWVFLRSKLWVKVPVAILFLLWITWLVPSLSKKSPSHKDWDQTQVQAATSAQTRGKYKWSIHLHFYIQICRSWERARIAVRGDISIVYITLEVTFHLAVCGKSLISTSSSYRCSFSVCFSSCFVSSTGASYPIFPWIFSASCLARPRPYKRRAQRMWHEQSVNRTTETFAQLFQK